MAEIRRGKVQNDLDLLRKNLNSKSYPKAACYRCPLLIHLVMYNTASKKKKRKKKSSTGKWRRGDLTGSQEETANRQCPVIFKTVLL